MTFIPESSYSKEEILKCSRGELFGPGNAKLPAPNMLMIDRITTINNTGGTNGLGQINDGALCQEFLQGTEYVLDGVSRDGEYKVCGVWEYDKRTVNGANFVYYGLLRWSQKRWSHGPTN